MTDKAIDSYKTMGEVGLGLKSKKKVSLIQFDIGKEFKQIKPKILNGNGGTTIKNIDLLKKFNFY